MTWRISVIVGFAVLLFVCCPCGKAGAVTAEIVKKCEAAVVAAFSTARAIRPNGRKCKGQRPRPASLL